MNTTTTTTGCTFATFREGYGGEICKRIGLDISPCGTWNEYTGAMIEYNNRPFGRMVEAAMRLNGVASSGERAVLHAVLAAGNFSAQADELSGGNTWDRMDGLGDKARESIAAAILRRD